MRHTLEKKNSSHGYVKTGIVGLAALLLLLSVSCVPKEIKTYGGQIGKVGVDSSRAVQDARSKVIRTSSGTPNASEKAYLNEVDDLYATQRTVAVRLLGDIKTSVEDKTKVSPEELAEWRGEIKTLKQNSTDLVDKVNQGPHGATMGAEDIAEITVDATALIDALGSLFTAITGFSDAQRAKAIVYLDLQQEKWPADSSIVPAKP